MYWRGLVFRNIGKIPLFTEMSLHIYCSKGEESPSVIILTAPSAYRFKVHEDLCSINQVDKLRDSTSTALSKQRSPFFKVFL